jgi:hypothetical protein
MVDRALDSPVRKSANTTEEVQQSEERMHTGEGSQAPLVPPI